MPTLTVSQCARAGPQVDRSVIARSAAADWELGVVRRAIAAATAERGKIADLFDRISEDPAGVGEAVGEYFRTLKKTEKAHLAGERDYTAKGGEEKEDVASVYSADNTAPSSTAGGRCRSQHFANDASFVPRQFDREPLDVKTLKLLGESIWSPEGKMNKETKIDKRKKDVHTGKIKRELKPQTSSMKTSGLLEKKQLKGEYGAGVGGKVKTVPSGNVPGFMMSTIKEKERLLQSKHEPSHTDMLRGEHERKLREAEKVKGRGRVGAGTRNPLIGVKKKAPPKAAAPTFKKLGQGIAGL